MRPFRSVISSFSRRFSWLSAAATSLPHLSRRMPCLAWTIRTMPVTTTAAMRNSKTPILIILSLELVVFGLRQLRGAQRLDLVGGIDALVGDDPFEHAHPLFEAFDLGGILCRLFGRLAAHHFELPFLEPDQPLDRLAADGDDRDHQSGDRDQRENGVLRHAGLP